MGSPNPQIPVGAWAAKQAEYIGSFRYGSGTWTTAIHLVASGLVKLAPLITHRSSSSAGFGLLGGERCTDYSSLRLTDYGFSEAVEAFNATKNGKSADGRGIIKALIAPPPK
jgi:D-xylulose reductase